MSFWDIVWFIFISFAFVAYLMVMFSIITDLFRDSSTSGLAKAVWVVALILLPLLTSLIYLVTRGTSMAERASRDARVMQERQEAYIKEVAGTSGPADQIAKAQGLRDSGVITEAEYQRLKEKALV